VNETAPGFFARLQRSETRVRPWLRSPSWIARHWFLTNIWAGGNRGLPA